MRFIVPYGSQQRISQGSIKAQSLDGPWAVPRPITHLFEDSDQHFVAEMTFRGFGIRMEDKGVRDLETMSHLDIHPNRTTFKERNMKEMNSVMGSR